MSTIESAISSPANIGTLAQLIYDLGDIPLDRILAKPPPGSATEKDLLRCVEVKKIGCELADGVLVVKTMGYHESLLAMLIGFRIMAYLDKNPIGAVAGETGICKLMPGLVRTPDVSFTAGKRLAGLKPGDLRFCPGAPDLCVEILSAGNTRSEMNRKLQEYFDHGAHLVWFVDPARRTAKVYTAPDQERLIGSDGELTGEMVLPGLTIPLQGLFADLDAKLAALPIEFDPPAPSDI